MDSDRFRCQVMSPRLVRCGNPIRSNTGGVFAVSTVADAHDL